MSSFEHLLPGYAGRPAFEPVKGIPRTMTENDAIGFIETQGFVGLLEGADAMCKAGDVQIIGKEKLGGGYITVVVRGKVAAVKAAVEAGAQAVENVGGKLILSHVIARPHEEIRALLPQ
jgi:ethanolamine utilization protein EutM